jgi:hypothetical protein
VSDLRGLGHALLVFRGIVLEVGNHVVVFLVMAYKRFGAPRPRDRSELCISAILRFHWLQFKGLGLDSSPERHRLHISSATRFISLDTIL